MHKVKLLDIPREFEQKSKHVNYICTCYVHVSPSYKTTGNGSETPLAAVRYDRLGVHPL